jgi:hypothetical protein
VWQIRISEGSSREGEVWSQSVIKTTKSSRCQQHGASFKEHSPHGLQLVRPWGGVVQALWNVHLYVDVELHNLFSLLDFDLALVPVLLSVLPFLPLMVLGLNPGSC